jgi:polar amino acid transport system substrate-binding protein
MKKFFIVLLSLLLVLSLAACGAQKPAESESAPAEEEEAAAAPADRLAEIQARGYIEICTEPYFAPYEFIDPSKEGDDRYLGFDIELMKAIAAVLGVELRIVPLEFDAVLAGINAGKYDLAISAIAYSPARAETMNLSRGYYFSDTGYGFIVREEDADKYNSIEDLADAVVITQSGSVQEGIYNAYVPKCKEFKRTSVMPDGYIAVAEGKADVCICSTYSAQLYAEANGGLVVPEFRFTVDPEMNAVCVCATKENTDSLIAEVNEVIAGLLEADQITKWSEEASAQAKALGIE